MINKKKEIYGRLNFTSNNDFYEIDKQIQNNRKKIYRKLTV
jgi:hypothetical protein